MRRTKATAVLGAMVGTALALVSGRALAGDTNKGDTGGKGGLGPKTTEESPATPDTTLPVQRNIDKANKKQEQEKPWELGASFETHRMLIQNESNDKVFNLLGVYALYRITENDTIGIREYFTENFVADPGETGVRADDVAATYTRSVRLPQDFLFSATASLSAPTSFASQKMGLITAPSLNLSLAKKVGRYINVSAFVGGGAFIVRYAEAEGGQPNPMARLSGGLSAEVLMPFHEPLSLGVSVNTSYAWLYNVQSGDPSVVQNGVVADAQYTNQPVVQRYGGEIYLRYTLPSLAGIKSDISAALVDGDPSLGGNSYLHDGVGYMYLFNRNTADAYALLSVRY